MARAYGSSAHLLRKREMVYEQSATGKYTASSSASGRRIASRQRWISN
jgi:hypothetical protein